MQDKYPKSYLKNCDESYADAKANFDQIKAVIKKKREETPGDPDEVIDELVEEIWMEKGMERNQDMNKKQTKNFLEEYIKQLDPALEMGDEAFTQIFKLLDSNGDAQISRQELADYIKIFTK